MAGNRCGKSETGCFEIACHLTGHYPDWFEGKRFTHPTIGWACGASGQSVRDVLQPKLFGYPTDETSTGFVSANLIISTSPSHGVSGLFDTVRVRHISGGTSTLIFKTYEQSVEKWMGSELDFCLVDEEAPLEHYDEALARIRPGGVILTTFTPLGGLTDLLCRFLRETDPDALRHRAVVQMSLSEAEHFTEEDRQQRIAGYAAHLREARTHGTPALGSGAVFTTPLSQVVIQSDIEVPLHWSKIWGIDFGIAHPFAAVLLAWDRDADTVYVLDCIRMSNALPLAHAAAIRRIAGAVRVAWPHDGSAREKTSGETLASAYRREGLTMLGSHATWADGGISTEAGIMEMQNRLQDGRLRVRAHCQDWQDEYRGYHRDKNAQLVKVRDDLLSATRIGMMALRHSRPGPIGSTGARVGPRRPLPATASGTDFDLFA